MERASISSSSISGVIDYREAALSFDFQEKPRGPEIALDYMMGSKPNKWETAALRPQRLTL